MAADPKPGPAPARRRKRKLGSPLDVGAAKEWHRRVTALGCRVCATLGEECEGVVQAHHVVRAQVIRRYVDAVAHERSMSNENKSEFERSIMWDTRNGLGVCYRAHRRHHNRTQPIPLALVPARTFAFAAEHGFDRILEQDYPG